jgi:peptidoglycan hydrolase-like protein with peptidoglycan-binding domain
MATAPTAPRIRRDPIVPPPSAPRGRGLRRAVIGFTLVIALAAAGAVTAIVLWSGAKLTGDPSALARVDVQALGGKLLSERAFGSNGKAIPLSVLDGRLTPRVALTPGERVSVDVVIRRPGALAWALGRERHERLVVTAPVAHVTSRWITVAPGSPVRVGFDRDVVAVAYSADRSSARKELPGSQRSVALTNRSQAGSVKIAAAARPWERLGAATTITWFPRAGHPVAVTRPAPDGKLSPAGPLKLTFSEPVDQALGSQLPTLSPRPPGKWTKTDSHTLTFTATGYGLSFGSAVHVVLPRAVAVTGPDGAGALKTTTSLTWHVPGGSTRRLHQLLAQAGYLPLDWKPSGRAVARTPSAEVQAAVSAPAGDFTWRYGNTPPELKGMWSPDKESAITRGAIMKFQDEHGLGVDAVAGPQLWHALLKNAISGKKRTGDYSYVYVHTATPQKLTLWSAGKTILTSPGNTGVPAAPTALGTFPVFEHLPVTTMSGTNPDGSKYNDPGIQWVSYFNGGDALHSFNRASFGTPQSLGCVELPLAAAAKIWPYTPIGTLVTIEN